MADKALLQAAGYCLTGIPLPAVTDTKDGFFNLEIHAKGYIPIYVCIQANAFSTIRPDAINCMELYYQVYLYEKQYQVQYYDDQNRLQWLLLSRNMIVKLFHMCYKQKPICNLTKYSFMNLPMTSLTPINNVDWYVFVTFLSYKLVPGCYVSFLAPEKSVYPVLTKTSNGSYMASHVNVDLLFYKIKITYKNRFTGWRLKQIEVFTRDLEEDYRFGCQVQLSEMLEQDYQKTCLEEEKELIKLTTH